MKRTVGFGILFFTFAEARAQVVDLSVEIEARVVKTAESELGRIERTLREQSGIDASQVANITLPLQNALEEDLGRGPVKISPRTIFEVCLAKLREGQTGAQVGRLLVEMHKKGALRPSSSEPKKVASFIFDKEAVRSPDPHLPPNIRPAPGAKLNGLYQICIGTDGKITKVTTVKSISGADQAIMEQIHDTWAYKPQPVPVCSTRAFVFQFN